MRSNHVAIPIVALLLVGAATLQFRWVEAALERQARDQLDQQWAAMKGHLRLERVAQKVQDQWYYDDTDPDQTAMVNRLRSSCFIVDADGRPLHTGLLYQEFGPGFAAQVRARSEAGRAFWVARPGARRLPYMVRAGIVLDESRRSSFTVALATPLSVNRPAILTFNTLLAGVILTALLLGWLLGQMRPTID
jgi:hypothetical protein